MQRPPIELLPGSYDVPPCHLQRQPACLRPILPLPAFRIRSVGWLSRSFDDAIVMQIATCHSHVGQKSVLLVTDQSRSRHQRMSSSPPSQGSPPRSFPRQVTPRRSQAEAGYVVVRHYFHWPGHIAWKECQGQASTVAFTEGALPWGSWWCDGEEREVSWAHARISVNAMPSRGMIAVATVKRIESRVADRGFWLQTGRAVKAFSCGRASEPAVVTLGTTAVPRHLARSCMNNALLRESIWWRCMMGSHANEERQTWTPRICCRPQGHLKLYRIFDRLLLQSSVVCVWIRLLVVERSWTSA